MKRGGENQNHRDLYKIKKGRIKHMKNELKKVTEEWMSLERKTLEQRKIAETFYDEKLMQLIEKEFIKKNKSKIFEKVEYLIISVGTSYEPLVLSINLFNPRKILFLYTDVTEEILNKIVKYCTLDMTRFQKKRVHETDPTDIYREIKQAYLEWKRPQKLYIDFTGGTKSMSAAAAMAGAVIDVQMVYVGTSDYLVDFRKPYPGSETLYFIENPLAIFGDLEIEKAMILFDRANFSGAREKLEILKERIPDPNLRQQLNFIYLLAAMYEHWDALEFSDAYKISMQLNRELCRDSRLHKTFILMDYVHQLQRQGEVLEALQEIPMLIKEKRNLDILESDRHIFPLMFTMYTNAQLRENQEKYDMATLLLYRLLEMIEQRRLAIYGLYVSKMDYMNFKIPRKKGTVDKKTSEINAFTSAQRRDWLKEEVYQLKRQIFPKVENRYLPEQVSLLEGFIILSALGDKVCETKGGKPVDKLKRIRAMVFLRNNSIFAHGLGPVSKQDYLRFKSFVQELFQEFCEIEKLDFDRNLKDNRWLNPVKSEYYSKLGV